MCGGSVEVGQRRFSKYRYASFAVGLETPSRVQQRMSQGVLPVGVNEDNITVAAVMIGHNGLPLGTGPEVASFAQNITALYDTLVAADPKIHVLAMAIYPGPGASQEWVRSQAYAPTQAANAILANYTVPNPRMTYVDCTSSYLSKDNPAMTNATLLYDGVHQTRFGYEAMADCLEPHLQVLLGSIASTKAPAMMMANNTLVYSTEVFMPPSSTSPLDVSP